MTILVTGGLGFIGSNLCNMMLSRGIDFDIVDDMSNGHIEFFQRQQSCPSTSGIGSLFTCDFSDWFLLARIKSRKYRYVIHLAANPRVSYSVAHPVETHETNVFKTLKLIEACKGNIEKFVFASSCAVYGNAAIIPTTEFQQRLDPQSPYAFQKLEVESYLKMYSNMNGFESIALRFFNVYGPNALGDSPYTTALAAWLRAIRDGRPMRSDGDGSQSRDLIHINDVCEAILTAIGCPEKFGSIEMNIGTGKSYMNMTILQKLLSWYPQSTVEQSPPRPGDVHRTCANIQRAVSLLKWQPRIEFFEGMKSTADWAMNSDEFVTLTSRV